MILQSVQMFTKALDNDDVREGEPNRLVRSFMMDVSRIFELQRVKVLDCMYSRKAMDAGMLARIVAAIMQTTEAMAAAIEPHVGSLVVSGGKAGMKEIQQPFDVFDVVNPKVASFIRQYSIKLAGEVNTHSAEVLARSIGEGIDDGDSSAMLSMRVNDVYSEFSGNRSEMIARTESARAFVEGTNEAWRESGLVEGKVWLLANSACAICNAIASKFGGEPIPLDQPFFPLGATIPLANGKQYSVDYAAIMGPPGHPNCRCGVKPVLKGA